MFVFNTNLLLMVMMGYNSMSQQYNIGEKNKKYGCCFPDHYKNIAANITENPMKCFPEDFSQLALLLLEPT